MIGSAIERRARIGLAALAIGLALGGCDELRGMLGMEPEGGGNTALASTNTVTTTSTTAPSLSTPQASPANPQLAGQISAAVTQLNATTPMQVDAITTLTGVRSTGTDIIYEMSISQVIPTAQLGQLQMTAQNSNQMNLCANFNAANLIRMGATMSHHYTDPNGTRFQTTVSSCPG